MHIATVYHYVALVCRTGADDRVCRCNKCATFMVCGVSVRRICPWSSKDCLMSSFDFWQRCIVRGNLDWLVLLHSPYHGKRSTFKGRESQYKAKPPSRTMPFSDDSTDHRILPSLIPAKRSALSIRTTRLGEHAMRMQFSWTLPLLRQFNM
jgi:hypothetical protein